MLEPSASMCSLEGSLPVASAGSGWKMGRLEMDFQQYRLLLQNLLENGLFPIGFNAWAVNNFVIHASLCPLV